MGITAVPEAFTIGTDKATEGSAYWAFRDLAHYVDNHYAGTHAAIQEEWSLFERQLLKDQRKVERRALALYAADPGAAAEYLTKYSGKVGLRSVRTALELQALAFDLVTKP
jgi:dipeptidase